MAVSINNVHQKVLALANKEQRGYITPQEFNMFADLAQKEIFEQYFYDKSQYMRINSNEGEYSDIIHNLNEKIAVFESISDTTPTATYFLNINAAATNGDMWRLGTVFIEGLENNIELEEVQQKEVMKMNRSNLIKPTNKRPVYVRTKVDEIACYPIDIVSSNIKCTYIRKPKKPQWGYVVINNRAMYDGDSSVTTNFELHLSEENELVYKILKFAGLSIKRDDLSRGGQGLESLQVQQEKQ